MPEAALAGTGVVPADAHVSFFFDNPDVHPEANFPKRVQSPGKRRKKDRKVTKGGASPTSLAAAATAEMLGAKAAARGKQPETVDADADSETGWHPLMAKAPPAQPPKERRQKTAPAHDKARDAVTGQHNFAHERQPLIDPTEARTLAGRGTALRRTLNDGFGYVDAKAETFYRAVTRDILFSVNHAGANCMSDFEDWVATLGQMAGTELFVLQASARQYNPLVQLAAWVSMTLVFPRRANAA